MKTHIVLTPSNIEIEYRLAGAGSRLAAFVIDFALQIITCILLAVAILFGIYNYRFATLENVEGFALGFLIISWFVVYFCYFIICEMLMNGRSIGKMIFGLRVIRDNGQPVGLPQALVRNVFRSVLDIMYIGLFCILFSKKHKRIGDMVAGTVVIAEHYGRMGQPLLPRNIPDPNRAGMEQFPHLTLLPQEKDLLHMYLTRKDYLPDYARENLQKQWANYLAKKWQIPPALVDDVFLAGVSQLNEEGY